MKPSKDPLCSKETKISGEVDIGCRNDRVLIFGALTAIGSWLTLTLRGEGVTVFPLAYIGDATADELVWYRRDQLLNAGINVHFADNAAVLIQPANISRIVYIPRMLDRSALGTVDNNWMEEELNNFIIMLEAYKNVQLRSFVFLTKAASSSGNMVLKTWLYSFEATLAVYHKLYNMPIVLIQTGDVYGPWTHQTLQSISQGFYWNPPRQCWYIVDIALVVRTALALNTHCLVINTDDCQTPEPSSGDQRDDQGFWNHLNMSLFHTLENSISSSFTWAKAYVKKDTKQEVVMASYFTTAHDPQWNVSRSPNQFQYIKEWYQSIKQLDMTAVIFHDGLDIGFMNRVLKDYERVSFVLVPSLQNRTTNDARFYAYFSFLDQHPEISMVMLTDISDVRFKQNPFHLMHILGSNIYVGTDIDIFPSIKYMPWISGKLQSCFGHKEFKFGSLQCLSELNTVYNAGVIGGSRHTMMAMLWWVTHYLSQSPTHLNCNMAAVNIVLHEHFYEHVFTGFPLVSRFMYKQASPKGVYIIHK